LAIVLWEKENKFKQKKLVLSEKREKISNFFMKKHLLHNIHNNDKKKFNQNTSWNSMYFQPEGKKEFQIMFIINIYLFIFQSSSSDFTLSLPS
jgi:hypothetical protein